MLHPGAKQRKGVTPAVAIDCEMVGVGDTGWLGGCIILVCYEGCYSGVYVCVCVGDMEWMGSVLYGVDITKFLPL